MKSARMGGVFLGDDDSEGCCAGAIQPLGCVRMSRFAAIRHPRHMNAQIRMPHLNPIEPFKKWLKSTEKKKPPTDVPVVVIPWRISVHTFDYGQR